MTLTQVVAESEESVANIARLDAAHSTNLNALSSLLLRSESVASSKIERIEASIEDYAKASHGLKSNQAASSMVASTNALISLIDSAGSKKK